MEMYLNKHYSRQTADEEDFGTIGFGPVRFGPD